MKRWFAIFLIALVLFSVIACSKADNNASAMHSDAAQNDSITASDKAATLDLSTTDLAALLSSLDVQLQNTITAIQGESDALVLQLENAYSQSAVNNFFSRLAKEANTLYASQENICINYFKSVAKQDLNDYDTWDNAYDRFYDAWDKGMDSFYDAWDNAYDKVYDACYNAAESTKEWSNMSAVCSDAWTTLYNTHSNAWAHLYNLCSEIWSAFCDGDVDVDAVVAQLKAKEALATATPSPTPFVTNTPDPTPTSTPSETKIKESDLYGTWSLINAINSDTDEPVEIAGVTWILVFQKTKNVYAQITIETENYDEKDVETWRIEKNKVIIVQAEGTLNNGLLTLKGTTNRLFVFEKVSESQEFPIEKDTKESSNSNGLRKEFKDAMDSYEAFYDEYCTFLKKYKANPTDLSLLSQYVTMMQKLADMDALFNKWETSDLNDAEIKYFLEVQARVLKKLANAGQ